MSIQGQARHALKSQKVQDYSLRYGFGIKTAMATTDGFHHKHAFVPDNEEM